ncbi:MAG: restriction endonuclease subunit S [Elusimicrobiota bacterium]
MIIKVTNYFNAAYGKVKDPFSDFVVGKTPFISSGDVDNGVVGFFDLKPMYKNVISVARTGSIGSSFYHPYSCAINSDCIVLEPKQKFTQEQMLVFVTLLRKNIYRYSYARKVTPERLLVTEISDNFNNILGNVNIAEKIARLSKSKSNKKVSLSDREWKWFKYENLFDIQIGKSIDLNKLKQSEGGTNYIGRTEENNGITAKVINDRSFVIYGGNCITVPMVGNELKSSYQFEPFCVSQNVAILRLKSFSLNAYVANFLNTIIRKDIFRFAYGRTLSLDRLKMLKIKLPVDKNGNPDWQFVEDFIKSLPYSASI